MHHWRFRQDQEIMDTLTLISLATSVNKTPELVARQIIFMAKQRHLKTKKTLLGHELLFFIVKGFSKSPNLALLCPCSLIETSDTDSLIVKDFIFEVSTEAERSREDGEIRRGLLQQWVT